jgi:hypothetical protein
MANSATGTSFAGATGGWYTPTSRSHNPDVNPVTTYCPRATPDRPAPVRQIPKDERAATSSGPRDVTHQQTHTTQIEIDGGHRA